MMPSAEQYATLKRLQDGPVDIFPDPTNVHGYLWAAWNHRWYEGKVKHDADCVVARAALELPGEVAAEWRKRCTWTGYRLTTKGIEAINRYERQS
jgi:hypothetical protein